MAFIPPTAPSYSSGLALPLRASESCPRNKPREGTAPRDTTGRLDRGGPRALYYDPELLAERQDAAEDRSRARIVLLSGRDDSNLDGRDVFSSTRPQPHCQRGAVISQCDPRIAEILEPWPWIARAGPCRRRDVFFSKVARQFLLPSRCRRLRASHSRKTSRGMRNNEPPAPVPNFRLRMNNIAGLRPHRKDCYRLEAEEVGDKFIVHNYGHGGAGITMSWGCATKVRDIVVARIAAREGQRRIAVLGAGVMGLTVATLLSQLKVRPHLTIYAKDFYPKTTSYKAGGQWAPSSVEHDGRDEEFDQILDIAFNMHKAKIGHGYGVSARTNYALDRISSLDSVADNLVPEPKCLQQMPFRALKQPGYAYETLLIEPPIFLERLHHRLRSLRHVKFVKREFVGEAAVLKLPEPMIVNCTGLGTRNIWADPKLYAVKGHLVLLRPQPRLKYLFSGRGCVPWFQYVFPRQDAVVLGGTYQRYVEDEDPSQDTCDKLLAQLESLFNGNVPTSCADFPPLL